MSKKRMSPAVLADLARSGLTADDAISMHIRFVEPEEMSALFKGAFVSAYEIPYFNEDGKPIKYSRYRLLGDYIPQGSKKPAKYLQLSGSKPHFYLPPFVNWKKIFRDVSASLVITEGEKKAAAACKHGIPTIGLGGVWNWLVKDENNV